MERRATVTEAKAQLSKLLEAVEQGERVVICRGRRPVAVLSAYQQPTGKRPLGTLRGRIWMADDFDETPQWLIDAFGS